MLRQQPFKYGATPAVPGIHNDVADAPYVNGDPATGTEGSYIPCEAVDHPQTELVKLITSVGITPSVSVLEQVAEAAARYASKGIVGVGSGTGANAHTVTALPLVVAPKAYFDGLLLIYDAPATNTGAVTCNPFGLGDRPVVSWDDLALTAGQCVAGRPVMLRYKAVTAKFILLPWASASVATEPGGGSEGGTSIQTARFTIPDSYQYNLATDLIARGYDLTQPIDVEVTLPAGGIIGGGETGYAFRTGTGYASGSVLKLIVATTADIIGRGGSPANGEASGLGNGGAGGHALYAEHAISIDNRGRIAGGGGGGARNGAANANWFGSTGTVSGGAYGAGVHTTNPALFRATYTAGYAVAYYDQPGNYTGGGAAGGALGEAGQSAGGGTTGGAAGRAVTGNSLITWINTGTRLGAIT